MIAICSAHAECIDVEKCHHSHAHEADDSCTEYVCQHAMTRSGTRIRGVFCRELPMLETLTERKIFFLGGKK